MTPHPRLSKAGIELVKRFEGLRRRAARLDNGGWTIGYGHTVSAREGAEVSAEQAEILLIYDLDKVARAIDPVIFTPLNSNQFNALVAFAFNVGVENFRACAVLKRVNEGAYLQAGAAIELWRRATFQGDTLVVDGLVRRRAAEKALFLTPMDGFRPVPTPVVRPAYDGGADDLRNQARGLAAAADLVVPMDGERAVAKLSVEEAASNVTERLRELFPEPTQPEPHDLAAPPFHALEPELPIDATPEPVLAPAREVVAVVDEPPPPLPAKAAEAPVYDRVFEPPPRRFMLDLADAPDELPIADFGHRQGVEPAPAAAVQVAAPTPYLVLVAGLVGALMFVGALLAMIYGKATLLNLCLGLVGVVCMVPAGLRLLLGLFGERPVA